MRTNTGGVEQGDADQSFQYKDPSGKIWSNLADYLAYLAETTPVLDSLKPKKRKK